MLVGKIIKRHTPAIRKLGILRMEAALNAKFHRFFKITLVLPFMGDGIDIKNLLQRWYFDQIKGRIPRYGAMVVSVIWKVNRSIQNIM